MPASSSSASISNPPRRRTKQCSGKESPQRFRKLVLRINRLRLPNMITPTTAQIESLKAEWTDQFVKVNAVRPELKRFDGRIGRVVTVNWSGKALIDFADGGWYDITASPEILTKLSAEEAKGKYDPTMNSAQPHPERQG